jgi:flagellar basal body-associated protein FliL
MPGAGTPDGASGIGDVCGVKECSTRSTCRRAQEFLPMAKKEAAPTPAPESSAPAKKGFPIKTLALVVGAMLVQTGVVVVVMNKFGPAKTHAQVETAEIKPDNGSQLKEVQIVDDRFQNLQTGRVWIWDAAIFVQVKSRNAEAVEQRLKQRNAEVRQELTQIIGRAQLAQLQEADRQTLSRQILEALGRIFGNDDRNEPMIERVLIPKFRGFPADL